MDDSTTPSAITIGELTRLLREFEEKIKAGTEAPERFLTLSEIEQLWGSLIGDTNVLYSDMLQTLIRSIDERDLIRKKREYWAKGIRLRTHRRAEREILTLHGKITYSRNILIPADKDSAEKLLESGQLKSVVSLDCALGISYLPFKMTTAMMLRCAYWAQNQCSYQAAEEAVGESLGLAVNDDTIWFVANYIGRLVFLGDCKRAEETMKQYGTGRLSYGHSGKGRST